MKRYSFATFQVSDANREAFAICRAVADLQPVSPMPVVLIGDDGCGKTHLLYSIVNHVQAHSATTGLACITARDFPETVRQLVKDPAPVQRAKSAILLVDQLERFADRLEDLETIVRIFLESHHYVVLATGVNPGRLRRLAEGFRGLLAAGQPVPIHPLTSRNAREAAPEPSSGSDDAELRRRLDSLQAHLADREQQLAAQQQAQDALARDLERANAEIQTLRRAVDKGQTEIASLLPLEDEVARLRKQIERAEVERAAAERDQASLETLLAEKSVLEEEVHALRLELHAAQEQREQAQRELHGVVVRAQGLLALVEANRAKFARAENEHREQIQRLETLIAQHGVAAMGASRAVPGENDADLASLLAEQETLRRQFEEQIDEAKAEVRQAVQARDEAVEKLDQLTATHAALEMEFEAARQQAERYAREMEALRHEAAAQVAAANAQAGEIEREYAHVCATADCTHQTAHVVAVGLQSLRQQLLEIDEAMQGLTVRLTRAADPDVDASDIPSGESAPDAEAGGEFRGPAIAATLKSPALNVHGSSTDA